MHVQPQDDAEQWASPAWHHQLRQGKKTVAGVAIQVLQQQFAAIAARQCCVSARQVVCCQALTESGVLGDLSQDNPIKTTGQGGMTVPRRLVMSQLYGVLVQHGDAAFPLEVSLTVIDPGEQSHHVLAQGGAFAPTLVIMY